MNVATATPANAATRGHESSGVIGTSQTPSAMMARTRPTVSHGRPALTGVGGRAGGAGIAVGAPQR
jgi:hypothetical protein